MKHTYIAAAVLALAASPALAADQGAYGGSGSVGASGSTYSSAQIQNDPAMIRQIQQQLKSQGYQTSVDGVWGPQSQQALRDFQRAKGISASGNLDQSTLTALGVSQSGSVGASSSTGASGSLGTSGSGVSAGSAPNAAVQSGQVGGAGGSTGMKNAPTTSGPDMTGTSTTGGSGGR
ncbi:MAG TPA: peptidoglycan-binding domain-containing protein [Burkholderiales bacterium]|nr:peptidoglycan-binding domain-containing protein [Burkholderiales bacterium]